MRKRPLNVDSLVCCVLLLRLLSRWSNHVLCLRLTVGMSIGAGGHMHVKLKLDGLVTDMQCGRVKGYMYVPFKYECNIAGILIYFSLLS